MKRRSNYCYAGVEDSHGKLYQWYLPADAIECEPEAFVVLLCIVVNGSLDTKVVVKRFLVDAMAFDERIKHKIEVEMNRWYQLKVNHSNFIQMFGAFHVSSPVVYWLRVY